MTKSPLLTTADRFHQAQVKAWQAHPPPCTKSEVTSHKSQLIVNCDSQIGTCPLRLDPETCQHRKALKEAIKQYLADAKNLAHLQN